MKKVLFTLIALIISATSFAQLIANKTDNRVTIGVDLFSDFQLNTSSNWDARGFNPGASWYITYNFPMGESSKHTVSIGAGMSHHNYFSFNKILNPYSTDTLLISDSYRDTENFKRAKVNANYVDIPLELRFRIKDQVKIGVGFKLGILVMAKSNYVGPNDDGTLVHEKLTYIKDLERYTYSATLRVGWKWVSAFAAYQFNPVFEVGHEAPVIHPLSVGLTFAPF